MIDHLSPGDDTLFADRGAVSGAFGHVFLSAGTYDIELVVNQTAGTSGHELFVARGIHTDFADTIDWRLVGHQSDGQIGYPVINNTTFVVKTSDAGGSAITNLAEAEMEILTNSVFTTTPAVINYADPEASGGGGAIAGDISFPNDALEDDDEFAVEVTAQVNIPVSGNYTFGFRGDDGSSLQIEGGVWDSII